MIQSSATVEDHIHHDTLTLAAVGVAAYMVSDVVHEVLGHAVVCLLTGGKILLLTSVYFRNTPLSRLVAAAGPCANLVAGLLLWLLLRSSRRWSQAMRFFLLLAMAFNLFWAAGYFVYSGVANTGDWAIAIGGPPVSAVAQVCLAAIGVIYYMTFLRLLRRELPAMTNWATDKLLLVPYFAAGVAACCAALFYVPGRSGAVEGAVRESFLGNIVLLLLLRRETGRTPSTDIGIVRDNWFVLICAVAFIGFVLILGRGVRPV